MENNNKIIENNEEVLSENISDENLQEDVSEVSEEASEEVEEQVSDDESNPVDDEDSIDVEEDNNLDDESEQDIDEATPEENSTNIKDLISSFKPLDYFDFVNLHIHSKYSDGKADFLDVLNQAKKLGYRKIAICDHNTVKGHKIYQDDVLIPAVEFDCWCGYVFLHLLAYGIDVNNHVLDEFMAKNKRGTEADIVRIFAKRDVTKLISAIHEAGGIAVLAHPACCWALNLDKFVGKLVSMGLDGIEVYYPYRRHRAIIRFATLRQIKDIAAKYNLIVTGGTDCHSRNIL